MKVLFPRSSPARRRLFLVVPIAALAFAAAYPRRAAAVQPDREPIVRISGSLPPAAVAERDRGAVAPDAVMERMTMPLRLRPGAAQDLTRLLAQQQDPSSSNYRRWLTPEEFGRRFGLSDADLSKATDWLRSRGFRIDAVARSRGWINFTGTVAQVEEAFATEIRAFEFRGEIHQSNASEISLPASIASLLAAPIPLDGFHSRAMHSRLVPPVRSGGARPLDSSPQFDGGGGNHYLAPADYAVIYGLQTLFGQGLTGAGVTVGVAARTNIHPNDIPTFRSQFGLPVNNPQIIVNGKDPGIVSADEEGEAELDAEWSGAAAPNAQIDLVVSADTDTSDGIYASCQYIVDSDLTQIVTVSFGLCEQFPETQVFGPLWTQAAAQGMSVFVAAGDDGVAECEDSDATTATHGASVNGICSTPFDVCVGGTEFQDTNDPAQYWAPTNNLTTGESALSYIPEATWNESGGPCGALCASGGGQSVFYTKPSWQEVPGVPAANSRYVPDVSTAAGTANAYLTIVNGMSGLAGYGGTSVSTQSLAGSFALVIQKYGAQGNPNPRLYQIAAAQFSGQGPTVFHDITQGDNSVPGATGFDAGPGFDEATGLGSFDVGALVAQWPTSMATVPRIAPDRIDSRRRVPRLVMFP